MKFTLKDLFSKCGQIRRKRKIWPHSLRKSLMENFIFCAVYGVLDDKIFNKTEPKQILVTSSKHNIL